MAEKGKFAYLLMVSPGANNNKYYRMSANGDGSWTAEYGRVGSSPQKRTYADSQWNAKYNEKIRKGYVDQTDLVRDIVSVEKPKGSSVYKPIEDQAIAEIVSRLQAMAKKAIDENYNISSNKVTQAMVDEAQTLITDLLSITDVDLFNQTLLKLFTVIPRKMGNVKSFLANSSDDFPKIIKSEQDLLDVMKGQVVQKAAESAIQTEDNTDPQMTILEAMGLVFGPCSVQDEKKIIELLGDCAGNFKAAWSVKNLKTQEKFDQFCRQENITNRKLLWHGSRNENWWSIINTGLVLRPTNAVITGKMFGYGIYSATKARKSLGYTSLSGSYWSHGTSKTAFMALMDLAYGKPYDVYSFDRKFSQLNYENLQKISPGANCLHAHAGSMLRNDEIVVYREEQMTIKYLVELKP